MVAVDQTCFAQPAWELGAAVDEDGAAVLLLDLRDVLGERRTVMGPDSPARSSAAMRLETTNLGSS